MGDKKYSWKGSPNAGLVLMGLVAVGAVFLLLAGLTG